MKRNQRDAREGVPSGREGLGILFPEVGHRLEAVVAGPAAPEIGRAARAVFNPFGGGDRLAALGAGIFVGQIAEIDSGHARLPYGLFLKCELDRFTVGSNARPATQDTRRAMSLLNG
jgi:hypothetical protein